MTKILIIAWREFLATVLTKASWSAFSCRPSS